MNKDEIIRFVMNLIKEIETLGEEAIWERSGSIDEDLKRHKLQIEEYKRKLNDLIN